MSYILPHTPDCQDLPAPVEVYGRQAPAHIVGGLNNNRTAVLWWAFAFESVINVYIYLISVLSLLKELLLFFDPLFGVT